MSGRTFPICFPILINCDWRLLKDYWSDLFHVRKKLTLELLVYD